VLYLFSVLTFWSVICLTNVIVVHVGEYVSFEMFPIFYFCTNNKLFLIWCYSPQQAIASSFTTFLDHTERRTTAGRTPLEESSVRRRDLYLTPHNTHNRQTSIPPVGFEPTISAGERPQTYALDCTATGTGNNNLNTVVYLNRN